MSIPIVIIVLLIITTIGGSLLFVAINQSKNYKKLCGEFELPNENEITLRDEKTYSGILDIGTKLNVLHLNNWVYTTFKVVLTKNMFIFIRISINPSSFFIQLQG